MNPNSFKTLFFLSTLLWSAHPLCADNASPLQSYLRDGRIREGLIRFQNDPSSEGLFSLAVLQSLNGLQELSEGLHKIGILPEFLKQGIPFFQLIPPGRLTSSPDPATPEKVSALFRSLHRSLKHANATLSRMDDQEFQVKVNLTRIRIDFDGDGELTDGEGLLHAFQRSFRIRGIQNLPEELWIGFDRADATWLKAYTHLSLAFLEGLSAYDWRPVWNQFAHVLFQNPEPRPSIAPIINRSQDFGIWADWIAAIHAMDLQCVDPQAGMRALFQFQQMLACSRLSRDRVLAETDNDAEWLPSPSQQGPLGARITRQQMDSWKDVLDELDAITEGRQLLPHWRYRSGIGINLRKLAEDPPKLNLLLMIQGSLLVPYAEEGNVSDRAKWNRLTEEFGSSFPGFAIWIN